MFPVACINASVHRASGGVALSNDTSLGTFTIDGTPVVDTDTIQRANSFANVDVIATPTHPGATRTINTDPAANPVSLSLSVGDNVCTVTVTAEDGVTTQDHVVTVRRLTAGVIERTEITYTGDGSAWVTGVSGWYISLYAADGRHDFWGNTGTESAPSPGGTLHEVAIGAGDTAAQVASAFHAAMTAALFSSVSLVSNVSIVDDLAAGVRMEVVSAGPMTATVLTQGVDPS